MEWYVWCSSLKQWGAAGALLTPVQKWREPIKNKYI